MSDNSLPDWVIPPEGGFTADEFFRLPDLPKHTELIDGCLVFMSPQQSWHSRMLNLLVFELARQAPAKFAVERELSLKVTPRQVVVPDVLVVTAEAYKQGSGRTTYLPGEVSLVIEVMSPGSIERDREAKPFQYAKAGIRYFWRVERVEDNSDRGVVYVYELDPTTAAYSSAGIHHDRLKLSDPFAADIDLTNLDQWYRG